MGDLTKCSEIEIHGDRQRKKSVVSKGAVVSAGTGEGMSRIQRAWGEAQRRRRVNMELWRVWAPSCWGVCLAQPVPFLPTPFYFLHHRWASCQPHDTSGPQVLLQLWWVFAALFWLDVSKHPYAKGRAISAHSVLPCSSEHWILSTHGAQQSTSCESTDHSGQSTTG